MFAPAAIRPIAKSTPGGWRLPGTRVAKTHENLPIDRAHCGTDAGEISAPGDHFARPKCPENSRKKTPFFAPIRPELTGLAARRKKPRVPFWRAARILPLKIFQIQEGRSRAEICPADFFPPNFSAAKKYFLVGRPRGFRQKSHFPLCFWPFWGAKSARTTFSLFIRRKKRRSAAPGTARGAAGGRFRLRAASQRACASFSLGRCFPSPRSGPVINVRKIKRVFAQRAVFGPKTRKNAVFLYKTAQK